MSEFDEMNCVEVDGAAAELALGVLTGAERARVLAHLGWCRPCQEEVCQLAMTADALLQLLPGCEPPAGFETEVLARIGLSDADADAGAGPVEEG
jgi:hypothetical protein